MRSFGTLVYDEVTVPIEDVVLKDGLILLVGRITGPITIPAGGEARVHGQDGTLILIVPSTLSKSVKARRGQDAVVYQPVLLTSMTNPGSERWYGTT